MPQLPCYHSKKSTDTKCLVFPKILHASHTVWYHICMPSNMPSNIMCRRFEINAKTKIMHIILCNIMNNGIKYSVIQLWHKWKTTLIVGQAGQTDNFCGFSSFFIASRETKIIEMSKSTLQILMFFWKSRKITER